MREITWIHLKFSYLLMRWLVRGLCLNLSIPRSFHLKYIPGSIVYFVLLKHEVKVGVVFSSMVFRIYTKYYSSEHPNFWFETLRKVSHCLKPIIFLALKKYQLFEKINPEDFASLFQQVSILKDVSSIWMPLSVSATSQGDICI